MNTEQGSFTSQMNTSDILKEDFLAPSQFQLQKLWAGKCVKKKTKLAVKWVKGGKSKGKLMKSMDFSICMYKYESFV